MATNSIRVFRGFDLSHPTPLSPCQYGEWGTGIYFSTSHECAAAYSSEVVIECIVNLNNPLCTTAEYNDNLIEELDYEAASLGFVSELFDGKRCIKELISHARQSNELGLFGPEINNEVRSKGHDGIMAKWADGSHHIICFQPESIVCIKNIYLRGELLGGSKYDDLLSNILEAQAQS